MPPVAVEDPVEAAVVVAVLPEVVVVVVAAESPVSRVVPRSSL